MFSSIGNFLYRHRRKFIVTSAVVGGSYLLLGFARKKLREWQERETRRFLDMTRKKQHFESTERTCNQTILSLTKVVCESVLRVLNTDDIVQRLQQNPENKLELWEQLKVMIFSRICVLVYALCILEVTLRVQLNIIGGYLYKDSVHNDGNPTVNAELQSKYLSLCHHFVSEGIEDLCRQVDGKVKKIVEPISLKKKVTLQEIEQVFWSIQASLCTEEGDPVKNMVGYLVGDSCPVSDPTFDKILKETMDVLESDEVVSLTMSAVSRCFSSVVDEMAHLFVPRPPNKNHLELNGEAHIVTNGALKTAHDRFVDVNKVEMHLVKLLPTVNELVTKESKNGCAGIQDLLVQQLTLSDKLRLLGANIYEVFSSA